MRSLDSEAKSAGISARRASKGARERDRARVPTVRSLRAQTVVINVPATEVVHACACSKRASGRARAIASGAGCARAHPRSCRSSPIRCRSSASNPPEAAPSCAARASTCPSLPRRRPHCSVRGWGSEVVKGPVGECAHPHHRTGSESSSPPGTCALQGIRVRACARECARACSKRQAHGSNAWQCMSSMSLTSPPAMRSVPENRCISCARWWPNGVRSIAASDWWCAKPMLAVPSPAFGSSGSTLCPRLRALSRAAISPASLSVALRPTCAMS